jgi:tetratricopeptide (TPR) repeat protein
MRAYAIVRKVLISVAACLMLATLAASVSAQPGQQNVGGDIGGVFRPKNPETKKRVNKPPKPVVKGKPTPAPTPDVSDKVEELLEKGNQARDTKKYAEAQQAYEEALKLKSQEARAAYGLGNVYTDQRRWEDAEKSYTDAVTWNKKDVGALVALSVVLVQPLTGANNAKRFADAEMYARRATQLEPQNAVAWDRLGVALQARGLLNDDTEHAYRRAVELDPGFAAAYAHLARALRKMGRKDEAAPLYDRAIELAKDAPTLVLIGESLQAEQQWDKSEPVLRRALEIDPRSPGALYLLGRTLIVLKRYQDAEPLLKNAIELSPQSFQPYILLGQAYLALERYDDAEKIYSGAVDVAAPAERAQLAGAFGFEGVGDGYMKAKRPGDAARAYQRALDLDPGNQQLAQKLSRARG